MQDANDMFPDAQTKASGRLAPAGANDILEGDGLTPREASQAAPAVSGVPGSPLSVSTRESQPPEAGDAAYRREWRPQP